MCPICIDSNIGLDIGRDVIINILPSDDAFGIFSFTENTRSEIVDELQDKNSAVFTIFRGSKGAFGNVSVYWEVDNPTSDISPTSGYINFTVGELSMDLTIYVTNDIVSRLIMIIFDITIVYSFRIQSSTKFLTLY